MSVESRINSINDHLWNSYNVLELAGADLTGVNKNIVNLKMSWKERLLYFMNNGTQEVWNNWDKVSGTGTSLSLSNTEEAPMSLTYKGNTSQTGTPTPTTPILVQVVSGDNSIEVKGKNLIPITYAKIKSSNTSGSWNNNVYSYNGLAFTVNEDLSVVINGTASGNTAFNLIGTTNLFVDINISNGNYVLSGSTGGEQNMSTWGIYMAIKHSDNTTETQFCYNGDLAFTKVEGDTFFPVIRIGSGTVCNNIEIKPMIRKSGTNSTYQPYQSASYPISLGNKELCKIGTYQDKIDKSSGKNLFDESYYNNATMYTQQTPYFASLKLPDSFKTKFYGNINLKGTSQSLVFGFSNSTNSVSTRMLSGGTITNNVEYDFTNATDVYLVIGNSNGINVSTDIPKIFNNYNIMISTTSNEPYEPYGTGWYLKKEIGKVVLNGSENWSILTATHDNYTRFSFQSDIQAYIVSTSLSDTYGKCNRFSNIYTTSSTTTENVLDIRNTGLVLINTNVASTTADFKTWLGNNNVILYYVLATPTYETITDTTLIGQLEALKKSYEEQTNISQVNNDLPFELDITALREMDDE